MSEMTEIARVGTSERSKVESWRLQCYRGGISTSEAASASPLAGGDLHFAVEMSREVRARDGRRDLI